MENIKEYDNFVNEFKTYNISLSEMEYVDLLRNGIIMVSTGMPGQDSIKISYEYKGTNAGTINLTLEDFIKISSGDIVNKGSINIALQDIGLNRILAIRKKYKR